MDEGKKFLIGTAGVFALIGGVIYLSIPTGPECMGEARCIEGNLTRVIDGDTVVVGNQSIRFALASAPELRDPGGQAAKVFIEDRCPVGSTVLVDEDDKQTRGSYGRIVGEVHCNGSLNWALLEEGHGYIFKRYCKSSEFSNTWWAREYGC